MPTSITIRTKIIKKSYKSILKPILFRFDPEDVHNLFLKVGHLLGRFSLTRKITSTLFEYNNPILSQNVKGLEFKSPIGLSAGFDKNASLVDILPSVGFGFMELGSVTLNPYQGNPKPRLYRLKKSKALVVYFGLMNFGVKKFVEKLRTYKKENTIVGISVAKTNCQETCDEDRGIEDYYECLKYLVETDSGDYYTINISCPNTFGGEPFTTRDKLDKLLDKLYTLQITKPVFIKLPINLKIEEFDQLLQSCVNHKVTGVVIGNLTKDRSSLIYDPIPEEVKGGISGLPTQQLSNELISYSYKNYGDKLVIIGVGGIFDAKDAYEKIQRGATLLQMITGMVFEGPQVIGEINRGIAERLKRDNYSNIKEAIGTFVKTNT